MELTMAKGKVGYGGKTVLENLDLCLKPGDCLGLVGPNGAGKSTMLRTLAGILPLQAGALTLGDRPLGEWNRREWSRQVSYLPQERELPFGYTAESTVLMGRYPYLGWQQQEGSREKAQARACLGLFGLEKMAARPVTELSGGQRQRVLLARILIQQTPVVLLDEPTAELDLVYENTVLGLSRQLARAGRSVVLSLHDIGQAARYCTRLVLLGQGGMLAQGSPRDVLTEERLEAAYGVPFLVREQEGELTVRVRQDPDREAREEKWLEQILENREA